MSRSSPQSRAASAVNALDAPALSAVLLRQALDKLPASPRVLQRLDELGMSRAFVDHYIVPMGAAIWSTDAERMLLFPAAYFVRFLYHHGLLSLRDRPTTRAPAASASCTAAVPTPEPAAWTSTRSPSSSRPCSNSAS